MNRLKIYIFEWISWSGLNDMLTTDLVTMDNSSLEVQILIEWHLKFLSVCGKKSSEDLVQNIVHKLYGQLLWYFIIFQWSFSTLKALDPSEDVNCSVFITCLLSKSKLSFLYTCLSCCWYIKVLAVKISHRYLKVWIEETV